MTANPNPELLPTGSDHLKDDTVVIGQLLRYAHIFFAAIREILELAPLRSVCGDALSLSQLHLLKLISHDEGHQVAGR